MLHPAVSGIQYRRFSSGQQSGILFIQVLYLRELLHTQLVKGLLGVARPLFSQLLLHIDQFAFASGIGCADEAHQRHVVVEVRDCLQLFQSFLAADQVKLLGLIAAGSRHNTPGLRQPGLLMMTARILLQVPLRCIRRFFLGLHLITPCVPFFPVF